MNNQNMSKEQLIHAIMASSKGKIKRSDAENAAQGNLSGVLASLSPQDRQKLQAALSNGQATKELLSSDAAQKILKMLKNGGNFNG